ncbi:hypothetical protein INT43_004254 [Umbelopsis isabellina]|uniref:UBX domain-containing protein n=1 Tax=Mortierella isabellina TaxID=91625 RepID=A0A8H7UBW3_MORIS|nr:hypothetical protein INT43_004254 [Umbelopsis isabellina]
MAFSDEQLVQLLELGFDLDTSKAALLNTNTVEEAIDSLLSGRSINKSAVEVHADNNQTQSLETDQRASRGEDAPLITSRYNTTGKEKALRDESLKLAKEMKQHKVMEPESELQAHRRVLEQINEDRERVKSRTHHKVAKLNEHQTPTNSDDVQKSTQKKEKVEEREARKRLLMEIEEDKKSRKLANASRDSLQHNLSSVPIEAATSAPISSQDAFIQFRFPDGRSERSHFPASSTVQDILTNAASKLSVDSNQQDLGSIQMSTLFPRRTYSLADKDLTAEEAGFLPNCTLNITVMPSGDTQINTTDMIVDTDGNRPPSRRGQRSRSTRGRSTRGRRGRGRRGAAVWQGEGRTLTDSTTTENSNAPETSDSGVDDAEQAIARTAIRELRTRLHDTHSAFAAREANTGEEVTTDVKAIKRVVPSLRELCTSAVAVFLASPTKYTTRYLKPLDKISSEIAEHLLEHLIKIRKLDRTVLKRLTAHCYLQSCILNAYPYATDSLLEELCLSASSVSITKLSLSGCDVITNAGIQNLQSLKHLEYLDLSNCKATDKSLSALTKLPALTHLYLATTKITSMGLKLFAEAAQCKESLQTIVVNGCQGINSSDTFCLLANFPHLHQISLASTSLPSPCDIPPPSTFKELDFLDISNTGIGDTEVRRILSSMKALKELKLTGCRPISVPALSFLGRELGNLEELKFPSQNHDLNDCLIHYSRLNLTHLNLGNFKEINDIGMQHISCMQQLRFLSLEGSQITDDGLTLMKEMEHLEQLFLDRTAVTDDGITTISNFPSLIALSLAQTLITDKTLNRIGDPMLTRFTRGLRSLSVAGCNITNKGVRSLQ